MGSELQACERKWDDDPLLDDARGILLHEARAITQLAERLDQRFVRALSLLQNCRGAVLVTGLGKAGLIGRKISATLASLGICSHFLHATEAVHGDLGSVQTHDCVIALSASGETEEVVRVGTLVRERGTPLVAITERATSRLGRVADIVLEIGKFSEAGGLQLAPSTSTTMMLALGDALALVLSQQRRFRAEDFARNHPGGSLGRQLLKVEQAMRPLSECRVVGEDSTVREAFVQQRTSGRRSGAVMILDKARRLTGIFTDSDLARLLERKRDDALDSPIREVMTHNPQFVCLGSWLADAIRALAARKISELPVVDECGIPQGLIDITDVVAEERWRGEMTDVDPGELPVDGERAAILTFPHASARHGRGA